MVDFLIGYSAGAYLVSLLSTDERYLAAHKLSLRDIRGVVPVSGFYWVERTGVAPDRDKSVWGTDPKVWVDASPAHHLRADAPPDADGPRKISSIRLSNLSGIGAFPGGALVPPPPDDAMTGARAMNR